jgi:sulfotransferase family protein
VRDPAPFVIGASRSGTTLVRMMLDSHPQLAIPAETGFVGAAAVRWAQAPDPAGAFLDTVQAAENWRHFGVERDELARRLEDIESLGDALRAFYTLCAETQGKPRWGDKTPGHISVMPLIAEHLPEARFVHMVRDGRDVALSHRGLSFGPQTIDAAARWWRERIETARTAAAELPAGTYLEVRFEDLVADPEPELRRICDLVDLPWSDRMLAYHERSDARLVEQDEAALDRIAGAGAREQILGVRRRLRGPLDPARAGRWRSELEPAEVERFVAIAGDMLTGLGYATS